MADDSNNHPVLHASAEARADGVDSIVTRRSIARLQISRSATDDAQTLRRTPAMIAQCVQPQFVLIRIRAGRGKLQHRGADIALRADECVLLDGREPYAVTLADGSDVLCFEFPIDWAERYLPDPQIAVAVPLGNQQPWTGMLRGVMDAIHADDLASPPYLIARSLCTALALAVDTIEVRTTAHVRKTFKSLQRTLAEHASTCNLTVAEIAHTHGISPRYLHAIYSANGTSCGRELMRVRLELGQRLLLDPTKRARSIDDIAWECGFSDAGHFRRRFRAFFGVPPSSMRAKPLLHSACGSA